MGPQCKYTGIWGGPHPCLTLGSETDMRSSRSPLLDYEEHLWSWSHI